MGGPVTRRSLLRSLGGLAGLALTRPLHALTAPPEPSPTASGWRGLSQQECAARIRLLTGHNALSERARQYYQKPGTWPATEAEQVKLLRGLNLSSEVLPEFSRDLVTAPLRPLLRDEPLEGPLERTWIKLVGTQRRVQMESYRLRLHDGPRSTEITIHVPVQRDRRFENYALKDVVWALRCLNGHSVRKLQNVVLSPQPSAADLALLRSQTSLSSYESLYTDASGNTTIWASPELQSREKLAKSLFHESVHPIDTPELRRVWRELMALDDTFLSRYARDHRDDSPVEDMAETAGLFQELEGTPELEELKKLIPHRARWLDAQLPVLMARLRERSSFTAA